MSLRSLPVVLPKIPGQRWSCHSCGSCCRTQVVHLTHEDVKRIDEQGWSSELGLTPYVPLGRNRALDKRPDGACVFLDDANLCRIHARFGEDAKPLACRIYPFSVRPVSTGWQASLRFDCPSVVRSEGSPVGEHRPVLARIVGELDHAAPPGEDLPDLNRGVRATRVEFDTWRRRMTGWLSNRDLSLYARLIGASKLTETLNGAMLAKIRGDRFRELLDRMFAALPDEARIAPETPTRRQRGMLRQVAFVHAEHVTLVQRQENPVLNLARRFSQVRSARRFLRGRGVVPRLPGFDGRVSFEQVEKVALAGEGRDRVEDLLHRYLAARIEGRTIHSGGYYGWPVFAGFNALWLSVAAMGWLARYHAAVSERERINFEDASVALGAVDRAATRLPGLGTFAERARITYLARDDGVSRLVQAYWLISPLKKSSS